MTGKFFLDTNFLVYCFSKTEPKKRTKCLELLQLNPDKVDFVISSQVVKEFSAVMLKKFGVDPHEVKAIISDFSQFEIVSLDLELVKEGIDIHILHKISFWDSLIVAAAKSAHCHTILTEDLHCDGQIAGIQVQNLFDS